MTPDELVGLCIGIYVVVGLFSFMVFVDHIDGPKELSYLVLWPVVSALFLLICLFLLPRNLYKDLIK